MVEKLEDLDISYEDKPEDIDKKIKEKLGMSFEDMHKALAIYIEKNAEEIVSDMMNIAPYGEYWELIEDTDGMAKFLRSDVVKPENWEIHSIKVIGDNSIQFVFSSKAVDDGDNFKGFVVVTFAGKMLHAFCTGEC